MSAETEQKIHIEKPQPSVLDSGLIVEQMKSQGFVTLQKGTRVDLHVGLLLGTGLARIDPLGLVELSEDVQTTPLRMSDTKGVTIELGLDSPERRKNKATYSSVLDMVTSVYGHINPENLSARQKLDVNSYRKAIKKARDEEERLDQSLAKEFFYGKKELLASANFTFLDIASLRMRVRTSTPLLLPIKS